MVLHASDISRDRRESFLGREDGRGDYSIKGRHRRGIDGFFENGNEFLFRQER